MHMNNTSQQTSLQLAIEHQQAGRLQEAVEGYLALLQLEPNHPEVNYNMGVLALQMKHAPSALPYFLAALESDPSCGQYWIGYIDALYQAGQIDDARQVLAMARQQGLEGERVDVLAASLDAGILAEPQHQTQPELTAVLHDGLQPPVQEINALLALFNEGRLDQAATAAQSMTVRFPGHGFGWKMLGAVYKLAGLNAEALIPMQNAAAMSPDDAEVYYNLGLTLQDLGRLPEAQTSYRRAIQINPDFFQAHGSLGIVLQGLGCMKDAEASYRQAIEINPGYADAHNNLGNVMKEQGCLDEAVACYRRALQINPDYVLARSNLGLVLEDMGHLDEAEASFRRVLEIVPDSVDVHCSLGNVLKKLGRPDQAEASFRRALEIRPDLAELYFNLGNTLTELKRPVEAEVCYRQAIQIRPDYAEAHYNLGTYLMQSAWVDEAEASFRSALQARPDYADAHTNLGASLHAQGRMNEAVESFRRVIELKPDCAEAYNDLGNALRDSGRLDEAEVNYRRALELDPGHAVAHSNLIFAQDLAADISVPAMQDERRKWGEMHALHLLQDIPHANTPDPERRLRIGYVATDFRTNSAPTIFGTMLFDYDRSRFDVYAYSNETKSTALTERFQQNVTAWRNIFGMSDDEVADLIREDNIDILVDLAGHSGRNRLPVFAKKPAPIQVTAWGYSTGTGIKAIDVLFSDSVLIPPEERALYAEQVRYLPIFFSYYPCQTPPEVGPLPALATQRITFGTFTRMEKVTDETYRAWAAVLLAVPDSRMLFKNAEMDHAAARARVAGYFSRAGVDPERLIFQGRTRWEEHMNAFNQVDIALDTFPQGGGVTTLEGISMGVPLVTLRWPTFGGRMGASILGVMGLSDWVAETPEQYVEIAKQKAQDIPALAALRGQLRSRLRSSIVGDTRAYAGVVEQEYRKLWQAWCERHSSNTGIPDVG
jgi:predicted O-linked N-acetylglucosamine transferase (SPINDLY family)